MKPNVDCLDPTIIDNRDHSQVGQGNIAWIAENRDQLWAEAVARYRAGEKWWITSSQLLAECSSQQEKARLGDAWEDILRDKLRGETRTTTLRAAELLGLWDDRPNKTENRLGKSEQIRIGMHLRLWGSREKGSQQGREASIMSVRLKMLRRVETKLETDVVFAVSS